MFAIRTVELMKFETKRIRRKNKTPGEKGRNTPIDDSEQTFLVEVVAAAVMANELQERTRGLREVTSMFVSYHLVASESRLMIQW